MIKKISNRELLGRYGITPVRGTSFPQLERPVSSWGFVRLADLGLALDVNPSLVLANYWALGKNAHYSDGPAGLFFVEDADRVVWIPAGWAVDVLRAHEAGVFIVLAYCEETSGDGSLDTPDHVWNSVFHGYTWTVVYAFDRRLQPVSVMKKYDPSYTENAEPEFDPTEFMDEE